MLLWCTVLLAASQAEDRVLTPDRRGRARPDRHFDIEKLQLQATLRPADRAVDGEATYTLRRLSPGPLVLDQVRLDIASVTAAEGGEPLTWWTEGETLRIEVPDPVTALTISWSATPRAGMYFRGLGRGTPDAYPEVWTQGQDNDHRYWMPLYDHPDDRFAFEADIVAPAGWSVLTNSGVTLPSYLIMIAAAPYEIFTHPDDARFSVWVPPGTDKTAVSGVLDELPEMNAWFEERTGVAYPWGDYRQVFVQRFLYGGMENTSATVQNMSLLQPSAVDDGAGGWTREVVSHELAHQWFGDLLTCRDWRERWLNEGFAEFMAGVWMGEVEGEARYAERVDEWLRSGQHGGPLAGRFFHRAGTGDSGSVYSRGGAVLHMLRVMLGEELFWAGVRRYTTDHQHETVITTDLQRAMESVSGHNLDWFFQQWVMLDHIPELSVSHSYEEGELSIVIAQVGDSTFTLPLTVEVGLASGEVLREQAWTEGGKRTLTIPIEAPPRYVAFDPDGGLLAAVTQTQDAEDWAAQLDSPSAYARRVAIRSLGETDSAGPLAAVLADTDRPMLERTAAAAALGEQQSEAPLVAALRDARPGIRQAAAEGLQAGIGAEATAALARAVERDRDPYVRAEALSALARREPSQALVLSRRLVGLSDITEQSLASNAATIIGEEGTAADLRLLLGPQPGRLWGRYIDAASRLVVNLDEGSAKERARERAARDIEAALGEGDLRVRRAAVAALGRLRDPDSIPPLQALRRVESVGDIRDAAARSIQQIQAGQPVKDAADNALEARLEALEERLDEAEAELDVIRDRH
ncbi:MAG: aminopeptidase N [Myxococcota bacterium]|jgi:aminopeptidase N